MENAIKSVETIGLRKAAKLHGVPKSTLSRRKASGNVGFHGSGSMTRLSKATEELLVQMLQTCSNWGYGLTQSNIRTLVENYLKQTKQTALFNDGKPGKRWLKGFLRRWQDQLSTRKADNIGSQRAASCTDEIIDKYSETCKKHFESSSI